MKIEVDEYGETLTINGEAFEADFDGTFDVLAFYLQKESLRELPIGVKVRLVNRVAGSRETYNSGPLVHSNAHLMMNG